MENRGRAYPVPQLVKPQSDVVCPKMQSPAPKLKFLPKSRFKPIMRLEIPILTRASRVCAISALETALCPPVRRNSAAV
jgi:hypothetical protein